MPILAIPAELRRNYLANRIEFTRNLACWPMTAQSPFYRRHSTLFEVIDHSRENPWNFRAKQFLPGFECRKNDEHFRYLHFDLSETRDRTGFALCHAPFHVDREILAGEDVETIRLPFFFFDLIGIIEVSKTEELDFQIIPDLVFELIHRGFYIDLVTLDRFQSSHTLSILRDRGISCGKLSVDRTAYKLISEKVVDTQGRPKGWRLRKVTTDRQYCDAHQALKMGVYDKRCSIPTWEQWARFHPEEPHHPFITEALGAENKGDGTVDHGTFSRIDLLSGMAGAAYNCQNNAPDLGNQSSGFNDLSMLDTRFAEVEQAANMSFLRQMMGNVSTLGQFRAVQNTILQSSGDGPVDPYYLEQDEEINPMLYLGL